MAYSIPRFESMLFNNETTLRTDFNNGDIKPIVNTEYVPKRDCLRIRPPPLKDIHALCDWKVPNVPFDLYGKPKDIVRTNPREVQRPYNPLQDKELISVRKSRPRLVMTPAVSMNDIEDSVREPLIKDVYNTTYKRMLRETDEAVFASNTVTSPLPESPAPAVPIYLPSLVPPFVSPEWRMDSVSWDSRQLRGYVDPTREFWLNRTPKCSVCEETAQREQLKKMKL